MKVHKYDILQISKFEDEIVFSVISNGLRNDFNAKKIESSENTDAYNILNFLSTFEIIANKYGNYSLDFIDKVNYALKTLEFFQLSKEAVIVRTKKQGVKDFLTHKLINYTNEHMNSCATTEIRGLEGAPLYQLDFRGKNGFKHFVRAFEDAYQNDLSNKSVDFQNIN